MKFRTAPRKLKVSLEAASRRPQDAESVLQAKPRHWRDKLFTAVEEFTNEFPHYSKKIKSFARGGEPPPPRRRIGFASKTSTLAR